MSRVVLDIIVVLVIVCIGGFFSASEMALVSLREGQIRSLAKRGRRGQRTHPRQTSHLDDAGVRPQRE